MADSTFIYKKGKTMDKTISRIAVAGDWHGNQKYALKAIKYAKKQGADAIVQLGDFGVWTPYGYIQTLGEAAKKNNIILMFIDGNHEDFNWLLEQPIDNDGIRRLHSHVWHLPRGLRWEWCGVKFLALGGAYSIDKYRLVEGLNWWPQEKITVSDMYKSIEGGEVDVMFTHDCPDKVHIPLKRKNRLPYNVEQEAQGHRSSLGMVVDEVNPKFLFHGHYHLNYLHPESAAELADLVRMMNSYYSNLIEGHNTRPKDIERALAGAELEPETRPLALEAKAHVMVQREIDEMHLKGTLSSPTSVDFLRWSHRAFYDEMPEEFRFIKRPDGILAEIVPGEFRQKAADDVEVGRHLPPSSSQVQPFMEHFAKRFGAAENWPSTRIIAIASAHHRLNYIHPFPDGNGRWRWCCRPCRPRPCATLASPQSRWPTAASTSRSKSRRSTA